MERTSRGRARGTRKSRTTAVTDTADDGQNQKEDRQNEFERIQDHKINDQKIYPEYVVARTCTQIRTQLVLRAEFVDWTDSLLNSFSELFDSTNQLAPPPNRFAPAHTDLHAS